MAADLLPCPFCGGEAHTWTTSNRDESSSGAYCGKCLAEGDVYGTTPEAIAAWNRRAQPLAAPATTTGGRVYGPTAEDRAKLRDTPAVVPAPMGGEAPHGYVRDGNYQLPATPPAAPAAVTINLATAVAFLGAFNSAVYNGKRIALLDENDTPTLSAIQQGLAAALAAAASAERGE